MENNNLKKEVLNEYECEVFLAPYAAIQENVRAKSLEDAKAYLKQKYPEAMSVRRADHWW